MYKFNNTAVLISGAIFSFIALITGIILSVNIINIIGIMSMAYILGISVGSSIIYEFANPRLKIYLITGPLGMAFIQLSMKLFAADGKVTEIEIGKLKKYMTKEFGEEIGNAAEKFVKLNYKDNENLHTICAPLSKMSYSERIGVVSQLFAIIISNGEFCIEEEVTIQKIANFLHIGKKRYNIIKSNYLRNNNIKGAFWDNQNTHNQQNYHGKGYQFLNQFFIPTYNPFIIMGLENSASNEEIKKTYRDLVKKYHPDVILDKSDQFKKEAKTKFLEINEAYESIKKMRGIK